MKFVLEVVVVVVGLLVAASLYVFWWLHPKRRESGRFARAAGPNVFKFTDIPRGRRLSDGEVEGYVDRLLGGMTLAEKVHQMSGDSWWWDFVRLLVFEHFKYNDRPIPSGASTRLAIPPILFSDGPRGAVLGHSTAFPVAMARGASWDRALEGRFADAVGKELRAQGANFFGGVCINVLRHPGWGRAQETYGEDPYLLGEMAVACVEGVQRHNVMACAKHFALNSIDEPRNVIDVRADERTLREVYLPHFKRAVDAGAASVMSAYNRVNGHYAAENEWLLRTVLKGEWGFRGLVMSDFFRGVYDGAKGVRAGLDVEMPLARQLGPAFIRAVERGTVDRALVDESVRRILRAKVSFLTRPDPQAYPPDLVLAPDHVALSREIAEKSMVLLKNEGPLLPLDPDSTRSLAILGARAEADNLGDHGSSRVYPPRVVTLLQGLRERLGDGRVVFDLGTDLPSARRAAREADAVVVVAGLDHRDEGEWIPEKPKEDRGGDRRTLTLHEEERRLIQAVAAENRRVVVVLVGGSAITMEEWRTDVPAIVMAWYPGMEGGHALARLLFGDASPSGKLPITFPGDVSWLPEFDPAATSVEYGYYHGYTLAEKRGTLPAFPFGHGLSYTRFRYSPPRLSESRVDAEGAVGVSVDVTNTGRRTGEEVAQLYVGFPPSAVDRPVKLLRGFEKVEVAAGETRTVRFTLRVRDLAYWDMASRSWRVDPGEYAFQAGGSSRSADLLSAPLHVVAS